MVWGSVFSGCDVIHEASDLFYIGGCRHLTHKDYRQEGFSPRDKYNIPYIMLYVNKKFILFF